MLSKNSLHEKNEEMKKNLNLVSDKQQDSGVYQSIIKSLRTKAVCLIFDAIIQEFAENLTMKTLYKYGALAAVWAACLQYSCWHFATIVTIISWIILGGYYTIYLMYHTLPRDLL